MSIGHREWATIGRDQWHLVFVYHAAVRGIEIESVETEFEGDLDLRGLFGMSDDVRKGYQDVRVHMRVKSTSSAEELRELAMYSPVYRHRIEFGAGGFHARDCANFSTWQPVISGGRMMKIRLLFSNTIIGRDY